MSYLSNPRWTAEAREELRAWLAAIPDTHLRAIIESLIAQDDPTHLVPTLRGTLSGMAARVADERRRGGG